MEYIRGIYHTLNEDWTWPCNLSHDENDMHRDKCYIRNGAFGRLGRDDALASYSHCVVVCCWLRDWWSEKLVSVLKVPG
jgi:hypothetical protein